jgi:excisionase family DNA binding protein
MNATAEAVAFLRSRPTITVDEYARLAQCHPQTVRRQIKRGLLPAYRHAGVGNYHIRSDAAAVAMGLVKPGEEL